MKILTLALLPLISISLTACHSVGNVVPKTGPSMEQVYDSMGHDKKNNLANQTNEDDLKTIRHQVPTVIATKTSLLETVPISTVFSTFHKVPNPMLHLYVYPHLAGQDELPVPGYTTAFNVYDRNHFIN